MGPPVTRHSSHPIVTPLVNKLDRRRRRRVLLTTRSTCRDKILLSPEFGTKSQREVPWLLVISKFSYNTVWDRWKIGGRKHPCQNPARFVQSFRYNTGLWRTDGRTHNAHTALAQRRAVEIVSCHPCVVKLVETDAGGGSNISYSTTSPSLLLQCVTLCKTSISSERTLHTVLSTVMTNVQTAFWAYR